MAGSLSIDRKGFNVYGITLRRRFLFVPGMAFSFPKVRPIRAIGSAEPSRTNGGPNADPFHTETLPTSLTKALRHRVCFGIAPIRYGYVECLPAGPSKMRTSSQGERLSLIHI